MSAEESADCKQTAESAPQRRDFSLEFLDQLPAPVWRGDAAGGCEFCNAGWLRFTGQTPEETLGQGWLQSVHPEDRELCRAAVERCLREREPLSFTHRLRRFDGAYYEMLHAAQPTLRDGKLNGLAGVLTDLTVARAALRGSAEPPSALGEDGKEAAEQKRALDQLRQSERYIHTLIDSIPGLAVLKNAQGGYVVGNRQFCEAVGASKEQLAGKSDFDFFPKEMAEKYRDDDLRVLRSGEPMLFEEEILLPNRGLVRISTRKAPFQDEDGVVSGLVVLVFDLTERERMEDALRQSEERFRRAVMDAPYPVMLHADDGEALLVNHAWLEMTGYSAAQIPDIRSWTRLAYGERAAAVESSLSRLYDLTARVAEGEYTIRTAAGEQRTWSFSSAPLGKLSDGRRLVISMAVDTTERNRLEAQFLQAQKMEAVGRLAGGVAHDFNNILTVILCHSLMLMEGMPEGDPFRESLLEIRDAGERAALLTRQLLTFSRKQVVQLRLIDLNEVIGQTQALLRRLIGEDVELVIDLAPGLWKVTADAGQMAQIIMNLAVNARDAMPQGGRLTVSTANVAAGAGRNCELTRSGLEHVALTVSDTGCGMDAKTQAHIFEPFFTTKGPGKGTGLGLSTVYGIVHQGRGEIVVESAPGRGATFRICFPRALEPAGRSAPPDRRDTPLSGAETILLVEDEAAVRSIEATVLMRHGYRVLEAADGEEALRIAAGRAEPVDLLVTDIVMPGLRGNELAARLQALYPAMRVIFVSGYSEAPPREGPEGRFHFLQKPFAPEVLPAKVRAVLDGEDHDAS